VKAEELDFKPNTLSTRWEDLDVLVGTGKMGAFISSGREEVASEFRKELAAAQTTDPQLGGAVRWIIQADGASSLKLVLQGLPAAAKALNRHSGLASNYCPAVNLHTRTVLTNFFTR
jgi:hypothetical protein